MVIMIRIKLWAFYQLMAWNSLIRPSDGQEMIDLAQGAKAARDMAASVRAVFSNAQLAKRKEKGSG